MHVSEYMLKVTFEFWKEVFYFQYGVCFSICLYILIFSYKKRIEGNSVKFYLNVFFTDKNSLVGRVINHKLSNRSALIRGIVKRLTKEEFLIKRISADLCVKISRRFESLGIKCNISILHKRDSYLCLELNLLDVSFQTFILSFLSPDEVTKTKSEKVNKLLLILSFLRIEEFVKRILLYFIIYKMKSKLPNQLRWKLYEKLDINVEVISCNEREQGPFFLSTLSEMNIQTPSDSSHIDNNDEKELETADDIHQ